MQINLFSFLGKKGTLLSKIQKEMMQNGYSPVMSCEHRKTNTYEVYGEGTSLPSLISWKYIQSVSLVDPISWQEEWKRHCPYYVNENLCRIPIGTKELLLTPGAGFGDLSHPTTKLMLSLLQEHVFSKTVVDLGCGSGILGLASHMLGAKQVYSIDNNPAAIEHTTVNADLNQIPLLTSMTIPKTPIDVLLINMIFSEQQEALASYVPSCSLWLSSGILHNEQDAYLAWAHTCGMTLHSIHTEEQWLAFVLQRI